MLSCSAKEECKIYLIPVGEVGGDLLNYLAYQIAQIRDLLNLMVLLMNKYSYRNFIYSILTLLSANTETILPKNTLW